MAALLPQAFLMVVEWQLQAFEQIMGEQQLQMVKQRAVWQLQTVEQTVELIAGRAPQTLQREQTQDQKVRSPLAEATLTATAQGTQLAQGCCGWGCAVQTVCSSNGSDMQSSVG